ncbi:MAG: FAD-binding oxidoreductase [Sedimentisphaerales bacterium]|jgi:Na+-transporting NADH:ubiquinone oxidoreductase subunit F|nr:FAD-binding oxidoreductase [Sedimentisphaerales bacterium]
MGGSDLDYKIRVNQDHLIPARSGQTLLTALASHGVFLPTACGGRGACGLCKVKVVAGGGPLTDKETVRLGDLVKAGFRLACQVRIDGHLQIELPQQVLQDSLVRAVFADVQELTADTRLFRFELQDPPVIDFIPGQYVRLLCPPYPGSPEPVTREYSIASDPANRHILELVIRKVPNGICTRYCFDYLKIGQQVFLSRPVGQFGLSDRPLPAVFIAGGSGLAPFLAMLYALADGQQYRPVTLFFGARTVNDLYLLERLRGFEARIKGFRFVPVVAQVEQGQDWDGQVGLVTDVIGRLYQDLKGHEGYLCGPPGMIDAALKVLTALGMPPEQIYYDKF